jgi:phage terminase small subunit
LVNSLETDLNATRSAIAAGYSKNGADVAGARLLRNVKVAEEISKKTECSEIPQREGPVSH